MDYEMYERNLPPYLVHDRDAGKKDVRQQLYRIYLAARQDVMFKRTGV